MPNVLIVEDEPALSSALAEAARRIGFFPRRAGTLAQARVGLADEQPHLLILDITLPDGNGLTLLDECAQHGWNIPAVVITAHGTLENAIDACRRGAVHYLVKPIDLEELRAVLVEQLGASGGEENVPAAGSSLLIGASPAMQKAFLQIALASQSDAHVLIGGPTGSGKTSAARAIHEQGLRAGKPFVVLHCQALPENLVEAELFGHEKGAFTGASTARQGHLERADGGTLFLDEIGDLSAATQAKLLRFAEDGIFVRVGGREERKVDVRIITATHRNLPESVERGIFRADLLYRLRVLEVTMPPLRDRLEDLAPLASLFLGMAAGRRSSPPAVSAAAMARLRKYPWPGNVRELRNAMEHAAATCAGTQILPSHLPSWVSLDHSDGRHFPEPLRRELDRWIRAAIARGADYDTIRAEVDSALFESLLRCHDGKPSVLARELGINRATLRKRLKFLGIRE